MLDDERKVVSLRKESANAKYFKPKDLKVETLVRTSCVDCTINAIK